jgi:hypothetical protein
MIGQYLPNNNETATIAFLKKILTTQQPLVDIDGAANLRTGPTTYSILVLAKVVKRRRSDRDSGPAVACPPGYSTVRTLSAARRAGGSALRALAPAAPKVRAWTVKASLACVVASDGKSFNQ